MKLTTTRVCTRAVLTLFLSISFAVVSQLLTTQAASTFIVNTLGDTPDAAPGNGSCADATGFCTLRAAIQEANALPGDDAISFSVAGTINLTGALPALSSMTINGPGSSQLTIRRDTGGDYRIFSGEGTVSISGVTVTNGKTPDGDSVSSEGGGIGFSFGGLTLTDVNITGNRTGSGASGGGLAVRRGSLRMTNCRVTGNITGNGANDGGSSGNGGGILLTTTGGNLTNVIIEGNRTGDGGTVTNPSTGAGRSGSGGGIFIVDSVFVLSNFTVTNNTTGNAVQGAAGQGGGIYVVSDSTVFILDSTINNNRTGSTFESPLFSSHGGGIANEGSLRVLRTLISGNSTGSIRSGIGGSGAGIWNVGSLRIENSTISGNSMGGINNQEGTNAGGGISNRGDMRITNCTVTGNSASTNNFSGVAGNDSQIGTTHISNTIIAQNGGSTREVGGFFLSLGHNLIGNGDGTTGFHDSDIVGTTIAPINPLLGPLANNGGPTFTHALLAGSPALDGGSNELAVDFNTFPLTVDQRNSRRIADSPDANFTATVDIGAYEFSGVFEDIPDRTINEDTFTTFAFNSGDGKPDITAITASSSNQSLVPDSNLILSTSGFSGPMRLLQVTPLANRTGATMIEVTVNYSDGQGAIETFILNVSPVNDVPVNNVPASATTDQNTPLVFSRATFNPISINDIDAETNPIRVTLTAMHGTFSLASTTGLQFAAGDGNSDPTMTFIGSIAVINGCLNGSSFKPNSGFNGMATLQILSEDQGHTGAGGSPTTITNLNIHVRRKGEVVFVRAVYDVYENNDLATITLRRASDSTGPTTVNYSTSNGTASGGVSCDSGADYLSTSGSVSFNDGTFDGAFTVKICNDSATENNETINLTLTNADGAGSPGTLSTATLIIKNEETPVLLTDEFSPYAIALDLVNQTRDPFSLTNPFNLSTDERRRVSLFVWRLGLLPGDTNSSVSVTATDGGEIYVFTVEALSPVLAVDEVTQVVVRLPDSVFFPPRDLRTKVTLRGVSTNEALIKIGIP